MINYDNFIIYYCFIIDHTGILIKDLILSP
jgi:hypothetical protein